MLESVCDETVVLTCVVISKRQTMKYDKWEKR
jgi:hypothetical protein